MDVVGVSCYCEDMGMPHAWVRYKLQQVGAGGAALAGDVIGSNYIAGQKTLVAVLSIAQFTNNSPSEPTPARLSRRSGRPSPPGRKASRPGLTSTP